MRALKWPLGFAELGATGRRPTTAEPKRGARIKNVFVPKGVGWSNTMTIAETVQTIG